VSLAEPTAPLALLAARGLPALRLLPAPATEPPYDDEPGPGVGLRLVHPAPARPAARTALAPAYVPAPVQAPVQAPRLTPAPTPTAPFAPAPAPAGGLPPARPFAMALVQRLLEVRAGVRPLPQLQRDTTPGLYADLERVLNARPRTTGRRPTRRDVLSVHVQERPDGVAEVCATVTRGERAAALALRLQAVQGRWFCTELAGL